MDHRSAIEHLVTIVQDLSLARDLETIMAIVRTAARQITGADGATFVLREGGHCFYADEDAIEPLWKGQRFPLHSCISGWAMQHRESVAILDVEQDARIPHDVYRPTFVKSLVMVPIRAADPVGAIGTYWAKPHAANDDEIRLLTTLANSTAIALENVQLYTTLEQRVAERTAELVRVQRQKDDLAALVVHDLRSPANGIMLTSQLQLRREHPAKLREHWQHVHVAASSIYRMAMNMLDVLRSEDGTFVVRRAPTDLRHLLRELAEQMSPMAASHGQILNVDVEEAPYEWTLDDELFRRLIQNLVDNAIRYAPEGGRIDLAVVRDDEWIELRVSDDGPGISEEQRERIFDKWSRLEHGERRSGSGRGLGLTFCRLAAEGHGGTIDVRSREPNGCSFVVRLPA